MAHGGGGPAAGPTAHAGVAPEPGAAASAARQRRQLAKANFLRLRAMSRAGGEGVDPRDRAAFTAECKSALRSVAAAARAETAAAAAEQRPQSLDALAALHQQAAELHAAVCEEELAVGERSERAQTAASENPSERAKTAASEWETAARDIREQRRYIEAQLDGLEEAVHGVLQEQRAQTAASQQLAVGGQGADSGPPPAAQEASALLRLRAMSRAGGEGVDPRDRAAFTAECTSALRSVAAAARAETAAAAAEQRPQSLDALAALHQQAAELHAAVCEEELAVGERSERAQTAASENPSDRAKTAASEWETAARDIREQRRYIEAQLDGLEEAVHGVLQEQRARTAAGEDTSHASQTERIGTTASERLQTGEDAHVHFADTTEHLERPKTDRLRTAARPHTIEMEVVDEGDEEGEPDEADELHSERRGDRTDGLYAESELEVLQPDSPVREFESETRPVTSALPSVVSWMPMGLHSERREDGATGLYTENEVLQPDSPVREFESETGPATSALPLDVSWMPVGSPAADPVTPSCVRTLHAAGCHLCKNL